MTPPEAEGKPGFGGWLLAGVLGTAVLVGVLGWLDRESGVSVLSEGAASGDARPAPAPDIVRDGELEPDPDRGGTEARRRVDPSGLPMTAGITVLVTDPSDVPIAGAEVRIADRPDVQALRTDDEGRCPLPLEPSETESVMLAVDAEGYFHARNAYPRREILRVRLTRAITLHGWVLDDGTDAPVPGARVTLVHGGCKGCSNDLVTTGLDGSFVLPGVSTWEQGTPFLIDADGYARGAFMFRIPPNSPMLEHEFRLARGVEMTGRVLEWVTGKAIEGAVVVARHDVRVVTDAGGRFGLRVGVDDEGRVRLSFEAPGYCRQGCTWQAEKIAGQPLAIELVPSATVEGVVHDEAGEPVVGARVSVGDVSKYASARGPTAGGDFTPVDAEPLAGCWRGPETWDTIDHTDEQGRFRIEGIAPWAPDSSIRVGRDGYEPFRGSLGFAVPPGETLWKELFLTRITGSSGGSITGRVTLNGELAAAAVSWSGGEVPVDEQGAYRLSGVEPGVVQLRARIEKDIWLTPFVDGRTAEVEVRPGEEVHHDFDLRARLAPISGRVLHPDGRAGADLFLGGLCRRDDDWIWFDTTTSEGGDFELRVPAGVGPWDLSVTGHGRYPVKRPNVPGGAKDVVIVLPALGMLRYRAHDEESGKLVEFEAWLRDGPGRFDQELANEYLRPDPDGWRSIEIREGSYELMLRSDRFGYEPLILRSVSIHADRTTEVDPGLRRGIDLRLTLAPRSDPLPENHAVFLLEESAWDGVRHSEEDGWWDGGEAHPDSSFYSRLLRFDGETATLRGLAPGRYRFKVFPDDIKIEPERVELPVAESRLEVSWSFVR